MPLTTALNRVASNLFLCRKLGGTPCLINDLLKPEDKYGVPRLNIKTMVVAPVML